MPIKENGNFVSYREIFFWLERLLNVVVNLTKLFLLKGG